MKRNAPDLQYFYHVVKVDNKFKLKRSLFGKIEGSLFCTTRKEMAEKHIVLLRMKNY